MNRFKRFLAIILLLILPLQSTLAAIDGCCNGAVQEQTAEPKAAAEQASSKDTDGTNCCILCDLCNHSSMSFVATMNAPHTPAPTAAPLPRPESPFDSFIADVPARPDRA